jgi:hypothetical protein
MKTPEQETDSHRERSNHPIIVAVALKIETQHRRARDAAESAFAARKLGPAIADGKKQRCQSQRQQ